MPTVSRMCTLSNQRYSRAAFKGLIHCFARGKQVDKDLSAYAARRTTIKDRQNVKVSIRTLYVGPWIFFDPDPVTQKLLVHSSAGLYSVMQKKICS